MALTEIKNDIHHMIDELQNEKILVQFYELLKTLKDKNEQDNDLWNLLSDEQREDLDLAILESESEENWVSHKEVMKDGKQWLRK